MKVILGTGDLLTLRNVARASVVAMMAALTSSRLQLAKSRLTRPCLLAW